jgi:hypothetical protein
MVTVKCLYCDADNDPVATAGYCDGCGKKLPPGSTFRRTRHGVLSADGPEAEPERLTPAGKATSEALLTVCVLQLVAGGLFLVLGPLFLPEDAVKGFLPTLVTLAVPPALWVGATSWLARRRPRPAALAALAGCLAWAGLGFVIGPALMTRWALVDLVLLALLFWPIWVARR